MGSFLNNAPVLHDDDPGGRPGHRQPVGDENHRPCAHLAAPVQVGKEEKVVRQLLKPFLAGPFPAGKPAVTTV